MKNPITCILDACTAINLIHIDQDEYLIKKLKEIDIYISEKVFEEIRKNAYVKFERFRKEPSSRKEDIKSMKEEIDAKVSIFRAYQFYNHIIEKDYDDELIKHVQNATNYSLDNGEFRSTVLALYISRFKPSSIKPEDFYPVKLFFHTDDSPAKAEFEDYFKHQQIGYIEDTVDLLILLYRIDSEFRLSTLEKYLSELFAEYAQDAKLLLSRLREIKSTASLDLKRDKDFQLNLGQAIIDLEKLEFKSISLNYDFFNSNKRKYSEIIKIFEMFPKIHELQTSKSNVLIKIREIKNQVKTNEIFKL